MARVGVILLMDKILHDLKDSKLWELWYIPYNGSCRILSINSIEFQLGTWRRFAYSRSWQASKSDSPDFGMLLGLEPPRTP